jgi:outer membrane protein
MKKTRPREYVDTPSPTTKRTRLILVSLVLLTIVGTFSLSKSVCAQKEKLTLDEAIKIALEKNYDVRAMRNSMLAQKQDIGIARSYLLPQIALEGRFTRTNNPPGVFMAKLNQERFSPADFAIDSLNHPDPVTDYQSTATVEQALFSGKALLGWSMAKKDFSAKEQEYARKKEETVLTVVRSYLQVATAREYLSVTKAGITDAAEHVRIAESRERNGVGLYSDVLRAKTAFTGAEQALVTAEKNLILARKALGLVLGSADPFDVADERVEFPLRNIEFYSTAAKSRRDVKAMELRYENAGSNVTLAASRYLPTLGMRAGYQLNDHKTVFGSEGESWWLMGILRWDLFDGAGREYEYSKARYKHLEAGEHLAGLKSMVLFRITEAYLGAEEAGKIRELARSALATAEEGKKLVKSRYANSLSPFVDLLDVQLSVDTTRAGLIAKENEYQLAIIRLNYESGTILETIGVKPAMGRGNYDER